MIKEAIVKIVDKRDLTYDEAYAVMNEIMSGETTPTQNAAFLAALSTKSTKAETIVEISGCAAAMRDHAVKVETEKKIAEQNAELAVQRAEMQVRADTKTAEADAAYSIQQENQRKTIEITRANADIARKEKESELAEKEIALKEKQLDAEIRKQADAMKYKVEKEAEAELIRRQREAEADRYAREQQAEAVRYAMEQEAEGIRAKGLAEAEAIEKKAEAQKKMGEASVLEMYLNALPEVVKNASAPLAQTDKIVMYGDGNATKVVRDVMNSANQIVDGLKESTGIDLGALLAGAAGGKLAAQAEAEKEKN